MRQSWFTRGARLVLAVAALVVATGAPAAAKPKPGVKRAGSNLFALVFQNMNVNNQFCPVLNTGEVCVAPSGSGVAEGGFWPKGTPDSYIFNSGLQLGAVIPGGIPGFAWSGDTIGAFFMDPRGDQQDGSPITLVYNSLDAGDQSAWPSDGIVADTAVYNGVLLGRNSVSQEDLWFRSWDGSPSRLGGRTHPMGVSVDVRGMAWNYPSGNEDIMYFVYTFTNVTSSDPNDYNNVTTPNPDPAFRASLAALGADFQQENDAAFGVTIPTHGYTFDHLFAAFFEDCDVGTDNVSNNYSTPLFPFSMGVCYEAPFFEKSWTGTPGAYPTNIFTGPTFAQAPGFTAVKYLKSPIDTTTGKEFGITIFSNTINGATGYPDPVGVKQLYRYLSGTSSPGAGDATCVSQGFQLKLHYCQLVQSKQDTRFFESSGPFQLKPGFSSTIVVAYLNGPPVNNAALAGAQGSGDITPGFALPAESLAAHPGSVRPIETIMGEIGYNDNNADGTIEQTEVQSVPRSLLDKALKAQAVFDAKFLLPFAPDAPNFFLIPGDNQVTIVWEKSKSEKIVANGGDPYFAIASDPTNALYDPNFRQYDVEGYRVYRGRTAGALTLIAQFDYLGTQMLDFTGQFEYTNCAPELGVQTGCPVTFDSTGVRTVSNPVSLVGNVIQVPPGGRVVTSTGSVVVTQADTAVAGGGSGFPGLTDTGVPFAIVDRSVRNLFQYYYSVTAFDVNSVVSGPSSLESPRSTKTVTPRAAGAFTAKAGGISAVSFFGRGATALTSGAYPTLDATTGEFSGPFPPTDALQMGFALFKPELLDTGSLKVTLDSVTPGANPIDYGLQIPTTYYFRTQAAAGLDTITVSVQSDPTSNDASGHNTFTGAFTGQSQAKVYGGDSTYMMLGLATVNLPGGWATTSPGRGSANGFPPAGGALTGNRWWGGAATNENTPNPNIGLCHPSSSGCNRTTAQLATAGGALPGVTVVAPITGYSTTRSIPARDWESITGTVYRAADFSLYWGTAGKIDSVIDNTHNVVVPFNSGISTSWGILDSTSFTGITDDVDGNVGVLSWGDVECVAPLNDDVAAVGLEATPAGSAPDGCVNPAPLVNTAHLSTTQTATNAFHTITTTAPGFILYLAGQFWIMSMPALPASGTVWHARYIAGNISGASGSYAFVPPDFRPAAVPGISASASYKGSAPLDLKKTNTDLLAAVHTVPDPYYVTNALEITPSAKVMKFVNLPAQAIIRIYSVSGVLVQVLTHNDPQGGGQQDWDLRSRSNQFVASGVYFYHVETPDGKTKVGRFTVVQFAP
ncbi:MAG TPA: hypothetical protein VFD85_02830 [Gemmatimonadales bacterium]|nr:hypothetical protein [Gemmatimonadales bacterium]